MLRPASRLFLLLTSFIGILAVKNDVRNEPCRGRCLIDSKHTLIQSIQNANAQLNALNSVRSCPRSEHNCEGGKLTQYFKFHFTIGRRHYHCNKEVEIPIEARCSSNRLCGMTRQELYNWKIQEKYNCFQERGLHEEYCQRYWDTKRCPDTPYRK